jgi:hypothetical protein
LPREDGIVLQVLVVTLAKVCTLVMGVGNSIATTQSTLWNIEAMTDFKDTSI